MDGASALKKETTGHEPETTSIFWRAEMAAVGCKKTTMSGCQWEGNDTFTALETDFLCFVFCCLKNIHHKGTKGADTLKSFIFHFSIRLLLT